MKNNTKKKAVRTVIVAGYSLITMLLLTLALANTRAMAADIAGNVQCAGSHIAGATVILYAAGEGAPTQLAQGKTDGNGAFKLKVKQAPKDSVLYLIAKGGTVGAAATKGPNDAIALMALLGPSLPKTVTVNELTTVASTFTAARFINRESISGKPLGLRIAAWNVPNLVDPATGGWGKVLLDPINSTQTTTLANLNTLGSLISAFATVANDDWRARFFNAATPTGGATPKNTLEAMAGIAREPWANPKELYALFDEAYPQPKDGSRRAAPFVPYLLYSPPDLALMLCFAGGGVHVRCERQPLEWAELDAWLAVRCNPQHRRRRGQVRTQRDSALAANHRFHGHGLGRGRVGYRGDTRQSLGHELQWKDSGDGF
jgi:hypothetical protein